MKRRKKSLTTKTLTLRLAALALVMLLLPCLLGFYILFPSQLIAQREKEFGTGPLDLLESQQLDNYQAYLSANDHCLSLLFCRVSPTVGWTNYGGAAIDLSQKEGPVWAGTSLYNGNRNIEDDAFYDIHQFGRVDIEDAQSIRILFPSWESGEPMECSLFQGSDGHWYFWNWHTIQWQNNAHSDFFDIDVEVLDAQGNVLATYETTPSYSEEELGKPEQAPSQRELAAQSAD